jgi:mannose-1-phosphate guanylyltransferase
MVRALLLAAGLGTRLKPLTDEWPKCLMPIGGRPLLEYWLETLNAIGVREILVNTHFHADQVETFLSRKRFDGWVHTFHESKLLGTAGTLRANSDFFRGLPTMLIHADNWCHCDFTAFLDYHMRRRPECCALTMMTFETEEPQACGIVETDGRGVVKAFHEKVTNPPGKVANGAVYILEPEVLEWLEQNPEVSDFSTGVLPRYVGRIATWHNAGIHRDIGTIQALRAAQSDPKPRLYWPDNDEWQAKFESSPVFRAFNE